MTVTSSGSLTDAIDDLNRSLKKGQKDAATAVVKVARKAILDVTKTRRHGRLSMSNMNLRALSLKPLVRVTPTAAYALLRAQPAGAWAITEFGTRPHIIRPHKKDALTVRNAVYDEIHHPGAHGIHVWDTACDAADQATGKTVNDTFDLAMNEAMDG